MIGIMPFFMQLSLVIFIAFIISFLMRLLKQPMIIGYIITGLLIGILSVGIEQTLFSTFSQLGVAFLLFIVGLNLNPKVIKEVGIVAMIAGMAQIMLTFLFGFLIARAFGFSLISALYIAAALTFSSTIVIMKLLSDKKDLESLYGKITIGILILQDLVAIFLLMFVSTISGTETVMPSSILFGIVSIFILFFISIYILPGFIRKIAKSQELLFLFSIGWCFLLGFLFSYLGFSIEIGALLAGVSLSMSPYHVEISSKVRPLRDFFIILFFIFLGSQMQTSNFISLIKPALIFSLFVFIFKFLILVAIIGALGYTKRNGFFTGLSLVQVSEFSLILVALGVSLGHLNQDVLSLVTLIGAITIAGSTYMIIYSNKIYHMIGDYFSIFEKKTKLVDKEELKKPYEFVLFGYNRIGFNLLRSLDKLGKNYVVVDFNPETIAILRKRNIPCVYGDADNSEFLDELLLDNVKLAISTIPEIETNLLLVKDVRVRSKDAIVITIAHQIEDAFRLYDAGADYVVMPHFLGGDYASRMIEEYKTHKRKYVIEKRRHIEALKERLEEGHEHPVIEKHPRVSKHVMRYMREKRGKKRREARKKGERRGKEDRKEKRKSV